MADMTTLKRALPAPVRQSTALRRLRFVPRRARYMWSYVGRDVRLGVRWLWASKEDTNFTYDLRSLNQRYLAWFVAEVAQVPVEAARQYLQEVLDDNELRATISSRAANRADRTDDTVRYGRRIGWYAIARATKPSVVVETGTDKGLGSLVFAAALRRNGHGHVYTIDNRDDAGHLIGPPFDDTVTRVVGDSVEYLRNFGECVDLFIHDSNHTFEHETAELEAVASKMSPGGLILSDNATGTDALAQWCEANGRRFLFFDERPARHWWPGEGIGASPQP